MCQGEPCVQPVEKVASLQVASTNRKKLQHFHATLVSFNSSGNPGVSRADQRNLRPSKLVSVGVETLNI